VAPSASTITVGMATRRNRTRRLCRAARAKACVLSPRSSMTKRRDPDGSSADVADRRLFPQLGFEFRIRSAAF
jgi:hypothetical protein